MGSGNRAGKISKALIFVLLFGLVMPSIVWGAGDAVPARASVAGIATFEDIADSYAQAEIQALAKAGIVSGYGDGRFGPRQSITRAELAKILVLAAGLQENAAAAASFVDVPKDSWYRGYVGALVESGITQGTSAQTFSPQAEVTREALAVFFIRAFGLEETAGRLEAEAKLSDWDQVSDWARRPVSLAFRIGFLQGMDNGDGTFRFAPKSPAERQALARLAYEFIENKQHYLAQAGEPKQAEEPLVVEPPKPVPSGGGGGRRGGSGNGNGPVADIRVINEAGTHNGSFTIRQSGVYGPAVGTSTITGTLTVDPGASGEVTLQNIQASKVEVLSGSSNSVKLRGVTVSGELIVRARNQQQPVRIESSAGTRVASTQVHSGVILEANEDGTLGGIKVTSAAAGHAIELRGEFGSLDIEVESGADSVSLQFNLESNTTIKLKGDVTNVILEASENVVIDTSELSEDSKNGLALRSANAAEAAVEALPEAEAITLDHIGAVDSAYGLRNAAKALGGDISAGAETKLSAAKRTADELAVAADRTELAIGLAAGDQAVSVTKNVVLATRGKYGSKISWSSDNAIVINSFGAVTRPAGQDAVVTMTAQLAKGEQVTSKPFALTVLAQSGTPSVAVTGISAVNKTVSVTMNQSVANVGKTDAGNETIVPHVTLADGKTYKVGIWDEQHEIDGYMLSVNEVARSGSTFTLTAHATPYYNGYTYAVVLYTGHKGRSDYVEAARKSFAFSTTLSDDASLSGLVLDDAELEQLNAVNEPNGKTGFDPNIANYAVTVPYSKADISVTAVAGHTGASLSYGAGIGYDETVPAQSGVPFGPISLSAGGMTTITIFVQAESGSTFKSYNVFVYRESQPSGGAPEFAAATVNGNTVALSVNQSVYSVSLDAGEASVTIGPDSVHAAVYRVGLWLDTTDPSLSGTMLPITGIRLPVPHGHEFELSFQPGLAGDYVAKLFTGSLSEMTIAAVSPAFAAVGAEPADSVELDYLSHSSFILTTAEKKILMDPWIPGAFNLPMYSLPNEAEIDLMTFTHNHDDHNYAQAAPTARAANRMIHGIIAGATFLDPDTFNDEIVNRIYGDVTINTVLLHHFEEGHFLRDAALNAGFIYDTAGMRIVHLGDAFGPIKDGFTSGQIEALQGERGIDLLMLPIGDSDGESAIDSAALIGAIEDLQPKVVIPVHPWNTKSSFLHAVSASGKGWAIETKDASLTISRDDLPNSGPVIWNMDTVFARISDFRNTATTATTASFSFTPPAGATRVEIFDNFNQTIVNTTEPLHEASSTATVTGLTPDMFYSFKLVIIGGKYAGDSNPVFATTGPVPTEDLLPPAVTSLIANETSLTLTYSEALDQASVPDAADFAVSADSANVPVAEVAVSGAQVALTLQSAVTNGQIVTLSYAPGVHPIQDVAGNAAEALIGLAAVNQTPASGGGGSSVYMFTHVHNDNRLVVLDFTDGIEANTDDLKSRISIAADGTTFEPLGAGDTVNIQFNELQITFEHALTEDNAVIKVAPNALKDFAGRPLANEIVTEPIRLLTLISAVVFSDGSEALSGIIDADDTITIAFSRPIDPTSIDPLLTAGGSVSGTLEALISKVGGFYDPDWNATPLSVGDGADNPASTLALSAEGRVVTITAAGFSSGTTTVPPSGSFSASFTLKDLNNKSIGNRVLAEGSF